MATESAPRPSRGVPFNTLSLVRRIVGAPVLSLALRALRVTRPDKVARQVGQLYFARWLLLSPRVVSEVSRVDGSDRHRHYLLFISDFTGDLDEYLSAFARVLTPAMNLLWGFCEAWPGAARSSDFMRYVHTHQLVNQTYFTAYYDATVGDIRSALRVSKRIDEFVLEAGDLIQCKESQDADESFQAAYHRLLMQMGGDLAS
jgi:hypothetical protein